MADKIDLTVIKAWVAETARLREALKVIRTLPVADQDNFLAANMREIARAALAEPVACEHRWEPRTSRVMGVKTWQCDKCGEFGGSP